MAKLGSNYSKPEIDRIISEADDPNKVTLVCGKHMYVASMKTPPHEGCKDCWMAYYQLLLAKTPPHKREATLDSLFSLVHKMNELEERGQFDIKLDEMPSISIERNVPDKGEN